MFDADGYYRTGDVMAELQPDRLVYVDRRTNVLKLANGEFVATTNLEAEYSAAPLVRQIFVYGSSERSSLLAVIVPTLDALGEFDDDIDGMKTALHKSLKQCAAVAQLQSYEVPVDFVIATEPFTEENRLLSGVGKLLRPQLKEYYGERLEQMYTEIATAQVNEMRGAASDGGRSTCGGDACPRHPRLARQRGCRRQSRRPFHRLWRRFIVGVDILHLARGDLRGRGAGRRDHQPGQ